jgi:hypothetical protein
LIYTGLTEEIGKPREFEKNLEDESYFLKGFDIKIPIYETTELRGQEDPNIQFTVDV